MFRPDAQPNRPVTAERLRRLLDTFEMISDLTMPGLALDGETISGHRFYGCNFASLRLTDTTIEGTEFELCFFPFSQFDRARFRNLTLRSCVFGGSRLESCEFGGSLIVQCNFNGITARQTVFDDCDLLHTRFDVGVFDGVRFENCNLKETRYLGTDVAATVFRYSNQEDATFENGVWL